MDNVLVIAEYSFAKAGGIQTGILNNTRILKDEFHFDAVLFCSERSANESVFEEYGSIYRIPCDPQKKSLKKFLENITRPIRVFCGIYRILGEKEYTVVHCHDINKGAMAMLAAKIKKVPIRMAQCHNPKGTEKQSLIKMGYISFLRWILNSCANCKTGCSVEANEYMYPGRKNTKTYVINNELDLSKYNRRTEISYNSHRFVHVGRFTEQKNHEFLISVFKLVHEAIPDSTLKLIGWGQLEKSIKTQIRELQLNDCVYFLPFDSDVPDIFNESDYMIFPSRYEGFGRVLLEAQSVEVKCFASTVIPKTTDVGLCTYLDLDRGPGYWAEEIIAYINQNRRMTEQLLREQVSMYDVSYVCKQYAEAYRGKMLCEENV